MDDEVGSLLKRLDELGLRENTIVVFSSDQGPAQFRDADEGAAPSAKATARKERKRENKGKSDAPAAPADPDAEKATSIGLNSMGFAGPFRGGKHNQFEGGVRIPFIVRWPGQVQAGRVDQKSVISGADWLPTLCALTDTKINGADFDGEDTSSAWRGSDFNRTKPLIWKTSSPQSESAIRDGQWKLHHPNKKRGEPELYDIAADPGEKTNLAAQRSDIVKTLTAKLEAWQATLPQRYDKSEYGDK
jgi:N-acetylgalactosamine-6-sulfatase